MSKVFIIGPNYYNFLPAVESAYRELGWETVVSGYDTPVHPYSGLAKLRYKLSRDRDGLIARSREAYQNEVLTVFEQNRPDLVFIMNGDFLEAATLDCIRHSAKVALWLFDSRTKLPASVGHADHVDALFCFEQDDVAWFLSQGKQAFFLPQACDTSRYHPIAGSEKDIDILFVGTLFYSPKRKAVMNAVIAHFPERRIEVYGWYQPWFKGLKAWLKRPHKQIYKNVNVPSEKANELYNRAHIVLNIHQEHQKNGANPRVFEICGAGAYQICDWNPYIASLFPEGIIGLYHDREELLALIETGLIEDVSKKAALACSYVRSNHSFVNRMSFVVDLFRNPANAGTYSSQNEQIG